MYHIHTQTFRKFEKKYILMINIFKGEEYLGKMSGTIFIFLHTFVLQAIIMKRKLSSSVIVFVQFYQALNRE